MIKWALVVVLSAINSLAAVTRVGNGDEGQDLEGYEKIENGPIVKARAKAVARLKTLNVGSIKGLGFLIPEVAKSDLYMTKRDTKDGAFARTFAEPHAATRFSPLASKLDQNQLIALHIHEGLHRSLPPQIRENEDVVYDITLAIAAPDATHDRIAKVVAKYLPAESESAAPVTIAASNYEKKMWVPTSILTYSYRFFSKNEESERLSNIKSLHRFESLFYAFGTDEHPIGLGLGLSFAGKNGEPTEMGPLSLSARMHFSTARGFDIAGWSEANLNTTSNGDLKKSAFGRDTFSLGLSARRDVRRFYVDNILGLTLPGTADKGTLYYEYGPIYSAKVRAGVKLNEYTVGGFAELLLSDGLKVSNDNQEVRSTDRFGIISVGPELSYRYENITTTLFGRFILNRSQDVSYDDIGQVLGAGAGEGYVGASFAVSL